MVYDYKRINRYIEENRFEELIAIAEERVRMQFDMLLKLIRAKDKDGQNENLTDILMVTGPSASGKTTTSNLLAKYLEEDGYNCTVVSLDDYYFDTEITKRKQIEKGLVPEGSNDFDFETIEAIDVDFFKEQMKEYTSGKSVRLPRFDFTVGKRVQSDRIMESTQKDMIILEGIHAFNPILTEGLNFDTSLKIYICPFDVYHSEYEGKEYVIEPHQIRFMRRALRDNVHRAASLGRTMEMWSGVRKGEKNYMEPLLKYTDMFLNSSHAYEIAYLKKRILELAKNVTETEFKAFSQIITPEALLAFKDADEFEIPDSSLFNEFYM